MGWLSIFENVKARGLKDLTNPQKWNAFSQGMEIQRNGINLAMDEIISFSEQIVYRKSQCRECFEVDKCVDCKCKMPIGGITPTNFCSAGKWPQMMDNKEWEEFKKENNLNIKVG